MLAYSGMEGSAATMLALAIKGPGRSKLGHPVSTFHPTVSLVQPPWLAPPNESPEKFSPGWEEIRSQQ